LFLSNIVFLLKLVEKLDSVFDLIVLSRIPSTAFLFSCQSRNTRAIFFLSVQPSTSSSITTVTRANSLSKSSPLHWIDELPPIHFVPPDCCNSSPIGFFCTVSIQPCDKPCKNSGNCTNDPTLSQSYSCRCKFGFNGSNCELYIRPS